MTDQLDFEVRLEERLRARAAVASRPFDASTIAHQAVLAGGRGRTGATLRLPRWPSLRWVGLLLLTLAAIAAALVAGSRLLERSAGLPGAWIAVGPMQNVRDHDRAPSAVLLDGRVLFVGGNFEVNGASAELFDSRTNSFTRTGDLSAPRSYPSVTTLRDGRVLVAGGRGPIPDGTATLATAELFDPATGTFSPIQRMTYPRDGHHATLLADGRVLITGTFVEGDLVPRSEIYDPTTGTWSVVGSTPDQPFLSAPALLNDGRVFFSGGMEAADGGAATAIFDPVTGLFSEGEPMLRARYAHTSVVLADGRVLIIGGSDGSQALATVELYDPATGRFSATGSLVTERIGPAAVLLSDGRVVVAGGTLANDAPRSAEFYDPAVGTFKRAGGFASGWHIGDAHRLPDGRVLVTGGQPEVFDPAAWSPDPTFTPRSDRTFIATGDPIQDRVGHSAMRLPDGRVLVIGGRSPDPFGPGPTQLASAELFDPKTGSFTATGPMHLANVPENPDRESGQATLLLKDGQVLVIGDAWLSWRLQSFDPATGQFTDRGPIGREDRTIGQQIVAVQLPDDRIIVFGPWLDYSSTFESPTFAYELDLAQPRLTKIADMPYCMGVQEALALADGRVVLHCNGGQEQEARIFDPVTGQLSTLDVPSLERRALTLLADGRVLFINGKEPTTTRLTVYNPVTGRIVDGGTLPDLADLSESGRFSTAAITVLQDGRVLLVGGNEAVLFDPTTTTATTLPPPLAMRQGNTGTLLDDGRVLILGGNRWPTDRGVPHPLGAELFDPPALR